MSKTVRQFECRDDIWKRVEALAARRGVKPDEIVQAALLQLFTRKKDEGAAAATPGDAESSGRPASAPPPSPRAPATAPSPPRPRPGSGTPGPAVTAAQATVPPRRPTPVPAAAPAAAAAAPSAVAATPPAVAPASPSVSARGSSLPRPAAATRPSVAPASAAPAKPPGTPPLHLFCEGEWYKIDQDQFVIGRGSKFSDLAIKDANISRRHCAVVRRTGSYFIKDLESTNGIEFNGERVDNHKIEEGSVYFLCDHELRFTFESPD